MVDIHWNMENVHVQNFSGDTNMMEEGRHNTGIYIYRVALVKNKERKKEVEYIPSVCSPHPTTNAEGRIMKLPNLVNMLDFSQIHFLLLPLFSFLRTAQTDSPM